MIAEVLLSIAVVYFVQFFITTFMMRRKMPPGPFPYPIVGNIPHLFSDPVHPFNPLADKYGGIYLLSFPAQITIVVLNSASLVREGKLGNQDALSGKSAFFAYPLSEMLGKDLITADNSPELRFRKKVFKAAMHVFGSGIEKVSQRAERAVIDISIKEIDKEEGKPFSPRRIIESSIQIVLWEWLTSQKVQLNDSIVKNLAILSTIAAKLPIHCTFYQLIPFMKYLPLQFNRDVLHAKQIKDSIFPQEFQAHKDSYNPGLIRDLTDSFISCYEKEFAKENCKDIGSVEDIIGLMTDVMIAGADTTSSSLTWLLLYVALHPETQEKIHKELDVVICNGQLPSWKDAKSMPFLQATLCEVQRASGVLEFIGCNATRDLKISGYDVPKGTFVLINIGKVHQDEKDWPEPQKFKPERFLDCDGNFVGWSKLDGFLPFSVGRRECAGQQLAKIMMFTFASILFHRYKIEFPEGEATPTTEVFEAELVQRPTAFKIVAKKRN